MLALTDSGSAGDSSAAHETLLDLGVGYVGLRAEPDDPLVAGLEATNALSRVNASDGLMLWRVGSAGTDEALVPPARVRLVDSSGTALAVVPVDGPRSVLRSSGERPEGTAALVVSEEAGWAEVAEVRAGGERLEPVADRWPLEYEVAASGAQQLQITLQQPDLTWRIGTTALGVLVLFLALPFGSRRRRTP